MLEGFAKAVLAGVAVQAKRTGVVGNGMPVRVDQDRRGGDFLEELANDGFRSLAIHELDTLLEEGVDGAEASGHVGNVLAEVTDTSQERAELLGIPRHFGIGVLVRAVTLSALGLTPAEEMMCPRKSVLVDPSLALAWESSSCTDGGV